MCRRAATRRPASRRRSVPASASQYVKDPHVTVDIAQNRPFFILGEVRAAGQYPYVSGMTVQSAVAIAGGFSERASEARMQITRRINGVDREDRGAARLCAAAGRYRLRARALVLIWHADCSVAGSPAGSGQLRASTYAVRFAQRRRFQQRCSCVAGARAFRPAPRRGGGRDAPTRTCVAVQ